VTADPGETPAGTTGAGTVVDLTAAPEVAAAEVPPELLARSLGQYVRAWLLRIRGGDSGVLPVVLAIVVVAVSFQVANSTFLSPLNLVNLFEQSTVYMVLAMAEIFALLLGEIDLSVGLVMAFGSVVVAQLVQPAGANFPWWVAIIVALLACSAVGAIQGWLVARLRMPSFIVTLGGLLILEGVAICNVNRAHSGTIEGVPYIIPIVLVVLAASTVLLQRTRFGRYVYAIGGNAEAARRAGVSLIRVRTWGFVLASLTSGIAGVLFASWQVSLTTNIIKTANSYNGLYLLGVASQWIDVVVAAVLLAAATVDVLSRRGAPRQA
jgi:ribose/xylose/arabinose/galactoside ABC-type transport system permease subunit